MADTPPTTMPMHRARNGDADSLDWIVRRFTPPLYAQAEFRPDQGLKRLAEPQDLEVWATARLRTQIRRTDKARRQAATEADDLAIRTRGVGSRAIAHEDLDLIDDKIPSLAPTNSGPPSPTPSSPISDRPTVRRSPIGHRHEVQSPAPHSAHRLRG